MTDIKRKAEKYALNIIDPLLHEPNLETMKFLLETAFLAGGEAQSLQDREVYEKAGKLLADQFTLEMEAEKKRAIDFAIKWVKQETMVLEWHKFHTGCDIDWMARKCHAAYLKREEGE